MFNILVVDDEKIVVSGIRKCLQLYQYPVEIYEAYDGEEAKEILENNTIHILMTDIELPLINGLDLIKIAKKKHPKIKTVVFSAYSNFEYARKAISLNAVYYLLKPINVEEFREVMQIVLGQFDMEPGRKEDDLLFRDMFKNTTLEDNILSQIAFFNKDMEEALFALCYFKFNYSVLNGGREEFDYFVRRNVKVPYYIFKIDDTQCVIAFRYLLSNKFSCYDLYLKMVTWLDTKDKERSVFAVGAEEIQNTVLIYTEIEKIKHLKELCFYFNNKNIFLSTDSKVCMFTPTVDIQVVLDAIYQDIEEKNYCSMQINVEKLVELLDINRQLSPIYVKYLFFDIVKRIQQSVSEVPIDRINAQLECISNAERIEEIEECMNPLISYLLELDETQYTHNRRIVEQLLDYIHHNYSKDISLESLSEMVCLSPAYTSTIFKQETNQTITNYINGYRMKKAKQLLVETNMKLVDIYPLVGYSSLTYFCVLFKNMFGETPSLYRKK